jgi:hypothetical protein
MKQLRRFFLHFLSPWVPRKAGQGRNSQKCEKSEDHCTLVYTLVLHLAELQLPCNPSNTVILHINMVHQAVSPVCILPLAV